MRVSDEQGETEAIPVLSGGDGEVYLVRGQLLNTTAFRARYIPQPERRYDQRRSNGRRGARRVSDRLTEKERLALQRGLEWVRIASGL